MVEVQEQAFAAVEESKAEKIIVEEGEERAEDDVDEAEADFAFGHDHLGAQRGVAVHVVDVVGEVGVGVVEERVFECAGDTFNVYIFMDRAILESARPSSKETQL